jgi:hypothetical protein
MTVTGLRKKLLPLKGDREVLVPTDINDDSVTHVPASVVCVKKFNSEGGECLPDEKPDSIAVVIE